MVGLAVFPSGVLLGLAGEIAGIRAGVAVRRVLDQLLLRELEALGLAPARLADGALLLAVALLLRERLLYLSIAYLAFLGLVPAADSSAGGRNQGVIV